MNIITRVDPSKLPYIMPDMSVDARSPQKRTSWGSTFESTYSKCHVNICIWKGWKRMKRGEWVFSEVFDVFINIVDDNRTLVPFTPSIHHKKHFFLGKFKSIVRLISILGTRWKELISACLGWIPGFEIALIFSCGRFSYFKNLEMIRWIIPIQGI